MWTVGIQYDAPTGVVEEANRLLHTLAPKNDRVNWLHAYYEPGDPWCPVERIIIGEMQPKATLGAQRAFYRLMDSQEVTVFDELEGPNPRAGAYYGVPKPGLAPRLIYPGLPPSITRRQWVLWREQDALATPVWVLQGAHGGHPREYSAVMKQLLAIKGLPNAAPYAGDLPFAVLDERTIKALRALDKLAHWQAANAGKEWTDRTNLDAMRERKAKEVEFRGEYMKWLDAHITPVAVEMSRMLDYSSLPEGDRRYNANEDEIERRLMYDTDTILPEEEEATYTMQR